jgi:hypothetical protein
MTRRCGIRNQTLNRCAVSAPKTSTAFAIPEMPNSDYHSHPSLSRSRVKLFRDNRDAFAAAMKHGRWREVEDDPNDNLIFGCALHAVALEGLTNSVIQIPTNVLTKAGARNGKAWDEFAEECAANGLTPLKEDAYRELKGMVDALYEHPRSKELLFGDDAVVEESIFWRDADTHLDLRCRPDVRRHLAYYRMGVDLKGVAETHPEPSTRAIEKFGYDLQHVLYRDGMKAVTGEEHGFTFVFVKKKWPHTVRCYELDDEWAKLAEDKTRRTLEQIAECKERGDWNEPGWETIQALSPPYKAKFSNQWEYVE